MNFLTLIVNERNELIHHFSNKYDLESIHGCKEAEDFLDQQCQKANFEIRNLKDHARYYQEAMRAHITYLSSAEFEKSFRELWFLNQSRIVQLLYSFANNNIKQGDWVSLSSAGNFIKQNEPDELESLNKRYGYNKLKELVLATGLFDVYKEPTVGGGYRIMYRVKSENS